MKMHASVFEEKIKNLGGPSDDWPDNFRETCLDRFVTRKGDFKSSTDISEVPLILRAVSPSRKDDDECDLFDPNNPQLALIAETTKTKSNMFASLLSGRLVMPLLKEEEKGSDKMLAVGGMVINFFKDVDDDTYEDAIDEVVSTLKGLNSMLDKHDTKGIAKAMQIMKASRTSCGVDSFMGMIGPVVRHLPFYMRICKDLEKTGDATTKAMPAYLVHLEELKKIEFSVAQKEDNPDFAKMAEILDCFKSTYAHLRSELKSEMSAIIAEKLHMLDDFMKQKALDHKLGEVPWGIVVDMLRMSSGLFEHAQVPAALFLEHAQGLASKKKQVCESDDFVALLMSLTGEILESDKCSFADYDISEKHTIHQAFAGHEAVQIDKPVKQVLEFSASTLGSEKSTRILDIAISWTKIEQLTYLICPTLNRET